MSTNEVAPTSSAYPRYESYEQRLNTYFERFWPISICQNVKRKIVQKDITKRDGEEAVTTTMGKRKRVRYNTQDRTRIATSNEKITIKRN